MTLVESHLESANEHTRKALRLRKMIRSGISDYAMSLFDVLGGEYTGTFRGYGRGTVTVDIRSLVDHDERASGDGPSIIAALHDALENLAKWHDRRAEECLAFVKDMEVA